jgi:hypothetical protein
MFTLRQAQGERLIVPLTLIIPAGAQENHLRPFGGVNTR